MERSTASTQRDGHRLAEGRPASPTSLNDFIFRSLADSTQGWHRPVSPRPRERAALSALASSNAWGCLSSPRGVPQSFEALPSGLEEYAKSGANAVLRKSASEMARIFRQQLKSESNEHRRSHWLLGSWQFQSAVGALIFLNVIFMGVEADNPEWALWGISENVFTALFFIEMVLKLSVLKFEYFMVLWNWLDCCLVLAAVVDNWILPFFSQVDMSSFFILRIFRLGRVARVTRLFREMRQFSLILYGIAGALRTTCWVGALVCVSIYICAICCTNFIGHGTEEMYPGYADDHEAIDASDMMQDFNPHVSFGSMSRSMLTLLNMVILVEWSEVIRPVYEKQRYLVVFFLMFGLFVAFGVMNVIIGMIVDNVMQSAKRMEEAFGYVAVQGKIDRIEEVQELIRCFDNRNDGRVTQEELESAMACPSWKRLVKHLGFPVGMTSYEFLSLLDDEGEGTLAFDSLFPRLYRLITADAFQQHCMATVGMNSIKCSLKKQQARMEETQMKMNHLEIMMLRLQSSTPYPATASGLTDLNRALASALSFVGDCSGHQAPSKPAAATGVPQAKIDAINCICAKIERSIAEVLESCKALDETKPVLVATYCRTRLQEDLATCVEQLCFDTWNIGTGMPPLTEESTLEPATSSRKPPISIRDPGPREACPSPVGAPACSGEGLQPSRQLCKL